MAGREVPVHYRDPKSRSKFTAYCNGRSSMYSILTSDPKKVTCYRCMKKLHKEGKR